MASSGRISVLPDALFDDYFAQMSLSLTLKLNRFLSGNRETL